MRVLRLSTSREVVGDVPQELRSAAVAERIVAGEIGEPVETAAKFTWPDPRLPGLVQRWLDEFDPQLVFYKVSNYTVVRQTVALHLRKQHPTVAAAVERMCATRLVAHMLPHAPGFAAVRGAVRQSIGVSGYFTPPDVAAMAGSVMRIILRREGVGLVVRAPTRATYIDPPAREAADTAWRELHAALAETCRQLHVPYLDEDADWTDEQINAVRERDRVHPNVAGHAFYGEAEGHALALVAKELLVAR